MNKRKIIGIVVVIIGLLMPVAYLVLHYEFGFIPRNMLGYSQWGKLSVVIGGVIVFLGGLLSGTSK